MNALLEITTQALSMPMEFDILSLKIKTHVENIENFQNRLDGLIDQLKVMIQSPDFPAKERRYIELLEGMPGIGFLTAVTLIAEIGDFSKFHSPKAFVAFSVSIRASINLVSSTVIETKFRNVVPALEEEFSLPLLLHLSGLLVKAML